MKVIMEKLTNQTAAEPVGKRSPLASCDGLLSFTISSHLGIQQKLLCHWEKAFCCRSLVSFYCKSAVQVWWNRHSCNIHAGNFISSNHYIQACHSSFYSGSSSRSLPWSQLEGHWLVRQCKEWLKTVGDLSEMNGWKFEAEKQHWSSCICKAALETPISRKNTKHLRHHSDVCIETMATTTEGGNLCCFLKMLCLCSALL